MRQIEYVSSIGEPAEVSNPAGVSASSTPQPRLIVPEHINASYAWLSQTRQMLAQKEWRVRRVDYENAPFGHQVFAASPYRWWLGFIAWIDRMRAPKSSDQSVERAALFADPVLHFLLLGLTTIFVAWRFGALPAALFSIGLATLFPFVGDFSPGAPEERGLAHALTIWSVLPLVFGVRVLHSAAAGAMKKAQHWFFAAGVIGGLGLWIGVASQVPVLVGIAVGALISAWVSRNAATGNAVESVRVAPWRAWALGGALGTLAAYLIEFFPSHLGSWELRAVHPLYGLAWVGGGELTARLAVWIQTRKLSRSFRDIATSVAAVAALASLPVGMWLAKNWGFWEADPVVTRLTKLTGGGVATSFWAWMVRDGITGPVAATFLPLLLVAPAIWLMLRRDGELGTRVSIAVIVGPLALVLGLAWERLSWWNGLDALLLVLLVTCAAALGANASKAPGFPVGFCCAGGVRVLPGHDSTHSAPESRTGKCAQRR